MTYEYWERAKARCNRRGRNVKSRSHVVKVFNKKLLATLRGFGFPA